MILRDGTDSLSEALKLLVVSNSWASKRTPFFQTIKVIAAIFRAKVRRAIVGSLPLGEQSLVKIVERSSGRCWLSWPHP